MEESQCVLVVDDEKMIEEMIQRLLERRGLKTCSFADPNLALRFFEENPDRVRLLITDFHMPSMTGPDLIKALRRIKPELPVIVVSGHAEEYAAAFSEGEIERVLCKPFLKSELSEALEAALADRNTKNKPFS